MRKLKDIKRVVSVWDGGKDAHNRKAVWQHHRVFDNEFTAETGYSRHDTDQWVFVYASIEDYGHYMQCTRLSQRMQLEICASPHCHLQIKL